MLKRTIAFAVVGTLALGGCADMSQSQKSTAQGAGIGAAAGAVIGALTAGGNPGRSAATGAIAGAAVGAAGGYLWNQHLEKQKQQMEQATAGTGVQVTKTADNRLKINVPADAGFATGSAQLNGNLYPVLNQLASGLVQNPTESVQILGYTDSTGSDAINYPLSENRALSVKNYLVSRGVQPQRIATQGMGSQNPVASNNTAQGRAMNRRVEIFVASGQ
ncbi:OmpA family protein [Thiomonas delicata]|uniref:Inner membrane lipoprotein YiaD n=1 Tax=Thiomonas delicata TaxID=364030 RepID=A0A238D1J6_THIDL|nr:OmpA family protein [Thiomonas delicata]SBP87122.1 Inner membrane lipoprotein YiaD [Thiomonas delicata]